MSQHEAKAIRRLAYLSAAPMVSTDPNAFLGGPRTHVLGVIEAFEKLGWEVQRYIVGDRLKNGWQQRDNAQVLRSNWIMLLLTDVVRVFMGLMNSWRVANQFKNVDWAYERFASFQVLGRLLQRKQIPWILETNGLMFVEATQDRKSLVLSSVARNIEKRAYRDCDVLVCGTQALKDTILRQVQPDPAKVLVVPNAVDIEFFDPARHAPKRLFEGPTIGYVGNLIGWQALEVLIRALAELRAEGVCYELVVVGDGPQRAEWTQYAASLGLGDHVRFTGQALRSEMPGYIAGFDLGYSGPVILQSGAMYHSPVKLYEYMAMGRPAVASAYEDALKLIHEEDTGYLYFPGDPEDLKRVLRRAYAQQSRWPEMGHRSRLEIVANHSWTGRISTLVPQIERILEEKYGTPYPSRRRS